MVFCQSQLNPVALSNEISSIGLDPVTLGDEISSMRVASLLGVAVVCLIFVLSLMVKFYLKEKEKHNLEYDRLQKMLLDEKDKQYEKVINMVSELTKTITLTNENNKTIINKMDKHQELQEGTLMACKSVMGNIEMIIKKPDAL